MMYFTTITYRYLCAIGYRTAYGDTTSCDTSCTVIIGDIICNLTSTKRNST